MLSCSSSVEPPVTNGKDANELKVIVWLRLEQKAEMLIQVAILQAKIHLIFLYQFFRRLSVRVEVVKSENTFLTLTPQNPGDSDHCGWYILWQRCTVQETRLQYQQSSQNQDSSS